MANDALVAVGASMATIAAVMAIIAASTGLVLVQRDYPDCGREFCGGAADKVFVLTCMDYRISNQQLDVLTDLGFRRAYDHLVLAGSSLAFDPEGAAGIEAATGVDTEAWRTTIYNHTSLAIILHEVEHFVVIDHFDCGAFRAAFGDAYGEFGELSKQKPYHTQTQESLRAWVATNFPQLQYTAIVIDPADCLDHSNIYNLLD